MLIFSLADFCLPVQHFVFCRFFFVVASRRFGSLLCSFGSYRLYFRHWTIYICLLRVICCCRQFTAISCHCMDMSGRSFAK